MKRTITVLSLPLMFALAAIAADEITVNAYLKVSKGVFELTRSINQYKVSQFGRSSDHHIQVIGSNTWEQVTIIADVATNGWTFCRNLNTDRASYIDLGVRSTGSGYTNHTAFARLYGADIGIIPLHPTNSFYASSFSTNSGGINLEIWVNEQ